jgi:hypothetical protein
MVFPERNFEGLGMAEAKKYGEHAASCRQLAHAAEDDEFRHHLLKIAEAWDNFREQDKSASVGLALAEAAPLMSVLASFRRNDRLKPR